MPYLTELATIMREEGLHVIEVNGWKERGHAPFKAVNAVFDHHTGGAAHGDYPSLRVVRDGRPDLPGPLANLGLGRSGSVWIIAAGECWHAGQGSGFGLPENNANPVAIGIEAESTGHGDWTPAQVNVYPRMVAALGRYYGFGPDRVIPHKWWAKPAGRKIDPALFPGGVPALRAGFKAAVATAVSKKTPHTGSEEDMTDDQFNKLVAAVTESVGAEIERRIFTHMIVPNVNFGQAIGQTRSWARQAQQELKTPLFNDTWNHYGPTTLRQAIGRIYSLAYKAKGK